MITESNPCVRCGKERIKYKEEFVILNSTKTKITIYICPDKECQKLVDKQIAEKEERRLLFLSRSKNRTRSKQSPQDPSVRS